MSSSVYGRRFEQAKICITTTLIEKDVEARIGSAVRMIERMSEAVL